MFQVLDDNELKAEFFPGTNCNNLEEFTENFTTYER
jgi:hypothetical protein